MEPVSLTSGRLRAPLLRLQSDDRLARLAAAGSDSAFELLVRRHRPALQRAAARILSGPAAEDAVQQALLSAHQALRRNGLAGAVRTMAAPDRRQRRPEGTSALARGAAPRRGADQRGRATTGEPGASRNPPADDRGDQRALPARQRRALVLRELEGRSHDEIARSISASRQGAVRQLIHRARSSVRSAVTAVTPYALLLRVAGPEGTAPFGELVGGGAAGAVAAKALVAALLGGRGCGRRRPRARGKRGKADRRERRTGASELLASELDGRDSSTGRGEGDDSEHGPGSGSRKATRTAPGPALPRAPARARARD